MILDLADPFDAIGEAMAAYHPRWRDATWTPRGGQATPVRVGYEAPFIKVDALGQTVNAVQIFATGLVRQLGAAKQSDTIQIGPYTFALKEDPEPFGGGGLLRLSLIGPR